MQHEGHLNSPLSVRREAGHALGIRRLSAPALFMAIWIGTRDENDNCVLKRFLSLIKHLKLHFGLQRLIGWNGDTSDRRHHGHANQ